MVYISLYGCISKVLQTDHQNKNKINYKGIVTFQVKIMLGLSFMSFLAGHFEFRWAVFIMTD